VAPAFTVVTPTFNRAALLQEAHRSLLDQQGPSFEWIVVDDGSTDGTGALVAELAARSPFPVHYVWQENAGKHTAVNRGVALASGELVAILDSDDALVTDGLAVLWEAWEGIAPSDRRGFAGVAGHKGLSDGSRVGDPLPATTVDASMFDLRVRLGVQGDKFEVFRRDVLEAFPFPTDLGRFVTEALVWNRISRHYRHRWIDRVVAIVEYQGGGLSDHSVRLRADSWRAARLFYLEAAAMGPGLPVRYRLRANANYVRFSLHGRLTPIRIVRESPTTADGLLGFPLGTALYVRDRLHG
jgi:glycosyltransferase involved in cell wall biosynthesis